MISKVPIFLHQRAAPTHSTPTRLADKADRNKKMTDSNSVSARHSAQWWRAGVLISNIAKVDCHFELQKNLVKQHQVKLASTRQPAAQPPRHAPRARPLNSRAKILQFSCVGQIRGQFVLDDGQEKTLKNLIF